MTATINASTSSGLIQTADTSGTLALQSNGTTQLTVSSTGAYGQLKSGTAVSASGTSVNFTSIPSWVKRITVMLRGISTNGTSVLLVRIGSGSVQTTGYQSTGSYIAAASVTSAANTSGFACGNNFTAAGIHNGQIVIDNINSNDWVSSGGLASSVGANNFGNGGVTLSGTLDRVSITTVNGTDTFDAGTINIMYEG